MGGLRPPRLHTQVLSLPAAEPRAHVWPDHGGSWRRAGVRRQGISHIKITRVWDIQAGPLWSSGYGREWREEAVQGSLDFVLQQPGTEQIRVLCTSSLCVQGQQG